MTCAEPKPNCPIQPDWHPVRLTSYQTARRFAVAPMLAYTDRHTRFLYRLLSQSALLYTEMIHANAALGKHADRELGFDPKEQPLVVQLAGHDTGQLVEAAVECQRRGFAAVNLNIGCPSNKVRHGAFGACLMLQPQLVADQVTALTAKLRIPVTVKCRLGVDQQDYRRTLPDFLQRIDQAGCSEVIIHARKAVLSGLSPKQNRDVPPLDYPFVYRMKVRFNDLAVSINGGITSLDAAQHHLQHLDGIMIGRAILNQPAMLKKVDTTIFGLPCNNRSIDSLVCDEYAAYVTEQSARGVADPVLLRPVMNLFKGRPGGGKFRRTLAHAHASATPLGRLLQDATGECIRQAETDGDYWIHNGDLAALPPS